MTLSFYALLIPIEISDRRNLIESRRLYQDNYRMRDVQDARDGTGSSCVPSREIVRCRTKPISWQTCRQSIRAVNVVGRLILTDRAGTIRLITSLKSMVCFVSDSLIVKFCVFKWSFIFTIVRIKINHCIDPDCKLIANKRVSRTV